MAIIRHTDNDFDNTRMTAAGYEIIAIETYRWDDGQTETEIPGTATNSRSPTPTSPTDDTHTKGRVREDPALPHVSLTPTAKFPRAAEGAISRADQASRTKASRSAFRPACVRNSRRAPSHWRLLDAGTEGWTDGAHRFGRAWAGHAGTVEAYRRDPLVEREDGEFGHRVVIPGRSWAEQDEPPTRAQTAPRTMRLSPPAPAAVRGAPARADPRSGPGFRAAGRPRPGRAGTGQGTDQRGRSAADT